MDARKTAWNSKQPALCQPSQLKGKRKRNCPWQWAFRLSSVQQWTRSRTAGGKTTGNGNRSVWEWRFWKTANADTAFYWVSTGPEAWPHSPRLPARVPPPQASRARERPLQHCSLGVIRGGWAATQSSAEQRLQPSPSHGAHELNTKLCSTPEKIFFCQSDKKKKKYNFDSFTLDSYCVGYCQRLNLTV